MWKVTGPGSLYVSVRHVSGLADSAQWETKCDLADIHFRSLNLSSFVGILGLCEQFKRENNICKH